MVLREGSILEKKNTQYCSGINQAIFIHGDPTLFNIHESFIERKMKLYLYLSLRQVLYIFIKSICYGIAIKLEFGLLPVDQT